ncbi:uncharacterized protein SPPG_09203 [Spizellomyces punctatus DAOM BR117]|uniref:Uncharacterized protein n=1 Tax=Spizellomyces punctatus (strain DAOM BR117) TaxID=645134 RepID=A0A0L0HGN8_SPIPD|nr:uncharacterized protein SPPG_09203 [Spizellomyces punctatus DAOM BR117]KND00217.1 hypothetical protein SPPG_09203 [Spizellomyces punctatus DAOM BR117]|eukprot:XP_016608256.1 hypothetical protein SPPG_09203 [Spizellomyces punctatus DAOM BR117]
MGKRMVRTINQLKLNQKEIVALQFYLPISSMAHTVVTHIGGNCEVLSSMRSSIKVLRSMRCSINLQCQDNHQGEDQNGCRLVSHILTILQTPIGFQKQKVICKVCSRLYGPLVDLTKNILKQWQHVSID